VNKETGRLGPTFQAILSSLHYPNPAQKWSAFFAPQSYFALRADGRVLVAGLDGATIDVFKDGRQERRIIFRAHRRPVTNDEIRGRIERRVSKWAEKAARPGFVMPRNYVRENEKRSKKLPHYRYYPVVGRIIAGRDGKVLVERPDISQGSLDWDGPSGPTRWTLLSSDFELIGNVDLPAGFAPSIMNADEIVGTVRNAVDVPSVEVYSIARTGMERPWKK
jgi:hypothetical protein